jgi:hypothetical protein
MKLALIECFERAHKQRAGHAYEVWPGALLPVPIHTAGLNCRLTS